MRRRELKAAAVDLGERVGVMNDAVGKNNSKGAPYSPAIRVDSKDALLFVSGQLPLNHGSGEIESTSVGGQTKVAMNNALAIAEAHGAGVHDVVKVGIFTTKLDESSSINESYLSVMGEHRPARLLVEVSALPRQALVEIEMVVRVRD